MTYITDIAEAATVLAASNVQLIEFSQNIGQDGYLARMYFDDFIENASGCHEVQRFDNYLVIYGSDSKMLASEADAKLWAAKYSLGER